MLIVLDDLGMVGEACDFDRDTDFFHHFANSGFLQGLAGFDASAGQRKKSIGRCFGAAREQHAPIITKNRGTGSENGADRLTHTCWPPLM